VKTTNLADIYGTPLLDWAPSRRVVTGARRPSRRSNQVARRAGPSRHRPRRSTPLDLIVCASLGDDDCCDWEVVLKTGQPISVSQAVLSSVSAGPTM